MTLLFAALLAGMIVCLALEEKLHARKSVIAGLFAMISLVLAAFFGLISDQPITLQGQALAIPNFLAPLDLNVISIILGSAIFIDVISQSGIFTWIAVRVTQLSRGDPRRLFAYYCLMTVVFSALLNNVTAILIVGSLTTVSLEKLGRKDLLVGFLLPMGLLTNIGGLLTLISSVPNIIVGEAAGFSYMQFFLVAAPFVAVATWATIALGARRFRISPLADAEARSAGAARVAGFQAGETVESRGFFLFSALLLLLFIVAVATADLFEVTRRLSLGFLATAFAVVALVRFKHEVDRFYQAVDWDLILFFVSLFLMIGVMEAAGVLEWIGHGIEGIVGVSGQAGLLGSTALFSSVTDNIPLSAMLAKIFHGTEMATSGNWWSVIFGANLGGNFTPIGSASTLVAVTLIHGQKVRLTFLDFVRTSFPLAALHVALAVLYVLFVLPFLPYA
ncbi:MAG: SLC13 family permease [Planctomycetota bacterium]